MSAELLRAEASRGSDRGQGGLLASVPRVPPPGWKGALVPTQAGPPAAQTLVGEVGTPGDGLCPARWAPDGGRGGKAKSLLLSFRCGPWAREEAWLSCVMCAVDVGTVNVVGSGGGGRPAAAQCFTSCVSLGLKEGGKRKKQKHRDESKKKKSTKGQH